jgi:glycosyltransferase involved in cell wall biosynthesis
VSAYPKVSILVATYNQEEFIADTLDSALAQTGVSFEIVVVDDGSSDNTWEIVTTYAAKFPTLIKFVRNPINLGVTETCNVGLRQCVGEYISFLGGDDIYLPQKLARQISAMEHDKSIVLSYHRVEVFDSNSNAVIEITNSGNRRSITPSGFATKVLPPLIETCNTFISAVSVVVLRSAIPSHGFDRRIPVASDWMLWVDVLAASGAGGRAFFVPDVLARYRRHQKNVTNFFGNFVADPFVTLAIIEAKYPELTKSVESGRARVRETTGIHLVRAGKTKAGRTLLLYALLKGKCSIRGVGALISSINPSVAAVERNVRLRAKKYLNSRKFRS